MKKISVIFGTRPEAIKLCPLIRELKKIQQFIVRVCITAQHREMLDQVLKIFEIVPDIDLNLMQKNQTLVSFTSRALDAISGYLAAEKPDLVLIQGDTTTVFCASLASFYNHVPIGHVEAGLRTGNKYSPYPEEINRKMTTHVADYHFAPTSQSRDNLLKEGIPDEKIFVTGNTVIDALHYAVDKIKVNAPLIPGLPENLLDKSSNHRIVLITGHRRENFGDGFDNICQAIYNLSRLFPKISFVYPVHLNPNVREPVFRLLSGRDNIYLIEPLDYLPFVALLNRCCLVLTDSGGIQEEAPSLGKPVLVMRDTTERPEAIEAGTVKLTGVDKNKIIENVSDLLVNDDAYNLMARSINPYGDGNACKKIIHAIRDLLCN